MPKRRRKYASVIVMSFRGRAVYWYTKVQKCGVCVARMVVVVVGFRLYGLIRLLVDLGQELVVAEKRVLVLADLDGAAAELSHSVSILPYHNISLLNAWSYGVV
jgi:hypothetical protein